jgi:hypothetical protein
MKPQKQTAVCLKAKNVAAKYRFPVSLMSAL